MDAYESGWCGRCGRKRVECQKIIALGRRCTEPEPKEKAGK